MGVCGMGPAMSDTDTNTFPYTLEVISLKSEGPYQWAIRKRGKLVQRSDRSHPTEAKAHADGLKQIEKLLSGVGDDYRRR